MVVASFAATGCGGSSRARDTSFQQSFRQLWARYRDLDVDKSLALARDPGTDRWAFGVAYGRDGQLDAVNEAKQRCQQHRRRHGVEGRCQTFAVGDEVTGNPALLSE